jgi:formate hydrogenlyase subunit 4
MLELLLFAIVIPIGMLIVGIIISLYFKGFDRRFAAYYQSRIGPPILQPFHDLRKLMMKQNVVPENAVKWVFNGAPLLCLVSSIVLLFYVWTPYFASMFGLNDVFFLNIGDIILILYLLMIPGIAMIIGGFASGSPYASVGSQRETVILISTELPLAIAAITIGWKMSMMNPGMAPFSLHTISQNPIWMGMGPIGIIGGILILLTLLAVVPAELAKIPFDQAEAETEIAEGLLAEYSGRNLAFFHLAEGAKSVAFTSLIVILFIPYGFVDIFGVEAVIGGIDFTAVVDVILFLIKVGIIYFISVITVRIGFARLKIQHVARLFIIALSAIGLAGLILIWLDKSPIFG